MYVSSLHAGCLYLMSLPWPLAVLWQTWGSLRALPLLEWELGEAQAEQEMEPPGVLGWPELCAPLASLLLEELERLLPCRGLWTTVCPSIQGYAVGPLRYSSLRLQPDMGLVCSTEPIYISVIASCRRGLVEGSPGLPA